MVMDIFGACAEIGAVHGIGPVIPFIGIHPVDHIITLSLGKLRHPGTATAAGGHVIAGAYGLAARRVNTAVGLDKTLRNMLESGRPGLVEVMLDPVSYPTTPR